MRAQSSTLVRSVLIALLVAPALALGGLPATVAAAPVLPGETTVTAMAAPRLAAASRTTLTLDWPDVAQATSYRVRYSKYASLKSSRSLTVTASRAVLTGLKAVTRYYVVVQPVAAAGSAVSPMAASARMTFTTMAYAAPNGLRAQASARSADSVAVNWLFTTPGRHYQVQYATTPDFAAAATVTTTVASTAISGLATGQLYYFRVRSLSAKGAVTSGWEGAVSAIPQVPADPGAVPLGVGSFNVRNWNRTSGGKWGVRGPLIAAEIDSRNLDVVGLQEADFHLHGGVTQYGSLINLLNARGAGSFAAVEVGTTAGTRIIYNTNTVTVVRGGMRQLPSIGGDVKRYVVWAEFVQNATGRHFFLANTHLVPETHPVATKKCSSKQSKRYKMRKTQAGLVLAAIQANAGGLPVLLTGDMNSHKVQCPTNAPYRTYVKDGVLVDPLGNTDRSKLPVNPTTEVRIHSEWDTSNHYSRKPIRHNIVNGHHVDYVFVSPTIKTLTYEIVVNINDATLKYVGRHPSDHNMVRAEVLIPAS